MGLLKMFVNSAVRQVGRDGGKVISNAVYGDSHSTPHRIVKNKNGSTEEYNSTNLVIKKEYLVWQWFLALLLTLIPFINFIGFPYIIYRGVINITSKYTTVNELYNETIKVRDKRYNSGYRNEFVTKKRGVKLLKTDDELKFTKIKGIGYLVIALFYIPLGLYLYLNK